MSKQIILHTPGPWLVRTERADMDIVAFSGEREFPIALVSEHEIGPVIGEANARLIAAAPRLFDALKGMVGLIQLLPTSDQHSGLMRNHRYEEALAALVEASESECEA
jgi:hypothetical protein